MKQGINLFRLANSFWSRVIEGNPQFVREIQGRLKTRNIVASAAISVIIQFISVVLLLGELPDTEQKSSLCGRFGTALVFNESNSRGRICHVRDDLGHWMVNWQLWWLDLFITISFIGIITLLIVGTYMLVADIEREKQRGTLNFIRLTPQSAGSILAGKILGVPILLYTAIALLLPLHLVASWQSQIPLHLTLSFYFTVVASCSFFYSLGLLWSLLDINISGLKPWLASGLLVMLLPLSSIILLEGESHLNHFLVWALLFHPGTVMAYLVDASNMSFGTTHFLSTKDLSSLSFFGQTLWTNATVGISLILGNFCLWAYWCWSILKRRFHNPESTILSKAQSYWLTTSLTIVALGFTLQKNISHGLPDPVADSQHIANNFAHLQICLSIFCLGLIFALSPHRQALHDWARYRHQTTRNNSLSNELVFSENSPAIVAIAINLAIAIGLITPSIFILLQPSQRYLFWSLIIGAANILLCAAIVQFILTAKNRRRGVWSIVAVGSVIILPSLGLGIAGISIYSEPSLWLFSLFGTAATEHASLSAIAFAVFAQWLAVSVISLQLTRKLKQAGASETKVLMGKANALID